MTEDAALETTSCLLCGCEQATLLYETRDRLCGVDGRFALLVCRTCGLTYLSPRPTAQAIDRYYPAAYDPYLHRRTEQAPLLTRTSLRYGLRKRCRLVQKHRRTGRLLDVGCATGQFLAEMATYKGWQVEGVEPSASAVRFVREHYQIPVHQADLLGARLPDGHFDAVTMWDVVEHLHDPVAVVSEVARILKPDGVFVFRTPSLDSWDAGVFGPYWAGLDSPRHLAVFDRTTIGELLRRGGLEVVDFKTGSGSYFACLISLRFWRDAAGEPGAARRLVYRLAANPVARLVTALPLSIADAAGKGSEMVVVARQAGSYGRLEDTRR